MTIINLNFDSSHDRHMTTMDGNVDSNYDNRSAGSALAMESRYSKEASPISFAMLIVIMIHIVSILR